jgi:hypothetical protein
MEALKIGDVVTRKSYGGDIHFKIAEITSNRGNGRKTYLLKGMLYRILADSEEGDLEWKSPEEVDRDEMEPGVNEARGDDEEEEEDEEADEEDEAEAEAVCCGCSCFFNNTCANSSMRGERYEAGARSSAGLSRLSARP